MKVTITYEDVKAMNPCYDPKEIGCNPGYAASIYDAIQMFRDKVKNPDDIIWIICRKEYMTDRYMRMFAVWCAREVLKLVDADPRSVEACNVAERFANGGATNEELAAAAWDAARDAAWVARDVARDAQIDQLLTYFKES